MTASSSAYAVLPVVNSRRFVVLPAVTLCTLVLFSAPSFADVSKAASTVAQQSIRLPEYDEKLPRILKDSGLLSQLSNLPATIIGESQQHWQTCGVPDATLSSFISTTFSADEMEKLALAEATQVLGTTTIDEATVWMDSPSGQAIIEAESASATLSENDFDRYISELAASPGYKTSRAPLIRKLLQSTRSAEFVAVLNSELNAIVSLSSSCSPTSDIVEQLLEKADAERQDLDLVTLVVELNLQAPSAVVYRHLEDSVLNDYLQFSESAEGQAYHTALVGIVRSVLANRLTALGDWRRP